MRTLSKWKALPPMISLTIVSSFSDVPHGRSQPTTMWGDVRSLQFCPHPYRFAHAVKPDAVVSAAPIDRPIPWHQPASSSSGRQISAKRTISRKAKHLSAAEQLQLAQNIHPRDRVRGENRDERIEARKLWHRLSAPTPEDPLDPEEGFAEVAIRTAK